MKRVGMPYDDNVWYHVTDRSRLPEIAQRGLLGSRRGTDRTWADMPVEEQAVYLWPNVNQAWAYAQPPKPLDWQIGYQPPAQKKPHHWEDPVILRVQGIDRRNLAPDHEHFANNYMGQYPEQQDQLEYDEDARDLWHKVIPYVGEYEADNDLDAEGYWDQMEMNAHAVEILRRMPPELRQEVAHYLARRNGDPVMHYGHIPPHHISVGNLNTMDENGEYQERFHEAHPEWARGPEEGDDEDEWYDRHDQALDDWMAEQGNWVSPDETDEWHDWGYEDPTDDSNSNSWTWKPLRTASRDPWDTILTAQDEEEAWAQRRPFIIDWSRGYDDPNPPIWLGSPGDYHHDSDGLHMQPYAYKGEIWEHVSPPIIRGAYPGQGEDERSKAMIERYYHQMKGTNERTASDGDDWQVSQNDSWFGPQNDSLYQVQVPGEAPGMPRNVETGGVICARCGEPMHAGDICPVCGFEKTAVQEKYVGDEGFWPDSFETQEESPWWQARRPWAVHPSGDVWIGNPGGHHDEMPPEWAERWGDMRRGEITPEGDVRAYFRQDDDVKPLVEQHLLKQAAAPPTYESWMRIFPTIASMLPDRNLFAPQAFQILKEWAEITTTPYEQLAEWWEQFAREYQENQRKNDEWFEQQFAIRQKAEQDWHQQIAELEAQYPEAEQIAHRFDQLEPPSGGGAYEGDSIVEELVNYGLMWKFVVARDRGAYVWMDAETSDAGGIHPHAYAMMDLFDEPETEEEMNRYYTDQDEKGLGWIDKQALKDGDHPFIVRLRGAKMIPDEQVLSMLTLSPQEARVDREDISAVFSVYGKATSDPVDHRMINEQLRAQGEAEQYLEEERAEKRSELAEWPEMGIKEASGDWDEILTKEYGDDDTYNKIFDESIPFVFKKQDSGGLAFAQGERGTYHGDLPYVPGELHCYGRAWPERGVYNTFNGGYGGNKPSNVDYPSMDRFLSQKYKTPMRYEDHPRFNVAKTAADNVPGMPVEDSGHWVWLDGKVGFGGTHSDIADRLAQELGYNQTDAAYISNWIARGHCPPDKAVAVGTMKGQYPQIFNSTRDRNHIWDAVMRARDQRVAAWDDSVLYQEQPSAITTKFYKWAIPDGGRGPVDLWEVDGPDGKPWHRDRGYRYDVNPLGTLTVLQGEDPQFKPYTHNGEQYEQAVLDAYQRLTS